MTALDNVKLALRKVRRRPSSEAHRQAQEMLSRVGLTDKSGAYPSQLSGGQQQRVCDRSGIGDGTEDYAVRRADLGSRSRDDPRGARRHARPRKSGMTMLVVTHEMGFAREAADRIIFMDEGCIVEDADCERFFSDPRSERARTFLENILHH